MSSEKSRSPAMAIKVSKSRHNSRTKLRMKLLYIQKRDNVEFYLCCKFQLSPFSVRRKTDVKDGMTDKQTNELLYASTLGIMNKTAVEESTSLEQQLNLELKERKPQIRAHFSEISTIVSSSKYIPAT